MREHRCGLVVGKFCPLHRGHQHLIEFARAKCDELILISYTKPEFDRCLPAARQRWLDALYPETIRLVVDDARLAQLCRQRGIAPRMVPENDADAFIHREFTAWLCDAVLGKTVDAVFTSEDYGDGFAAVLGAYFSAVRGRAHRVAHVCLDPRRLEFPVSGTLVRSDPHRCRDALAPLVYADFVARIALLGGESSGKTTLAEKLAAELGTVWVPEFGRELWDVRQGKLRYEDMLLIAETHIAQEEALAREASRWLICDTTPLTTYFYSLDIFGKADPLLEALSHRCYDQTFLCAPDFPFVQDGTRRDESFRVFQHRRYRRTLTTRRTPYRIVRGGLEERIREIGDRLTAVG